MVAATKRVQDDLGDVDILVNNAGVMLLAPFSSDQRAELRQMIEVNLLGAITATEVFLDQLRDGDGDRINISSVAGGTARPGNAGYATTKWRMNGWSESLRQELQPDVRVIVIEPGAVATELTDHITHAETKAGAEKTYEQTSISAQDIAEVIASRSHARTTRHSTRSSSDPPGRLSDAGSLHENAGRRRRPIRDLILIDDCDRSQPFPATDEAQAGDLTQEPSLQTSREVSPGAGCLKGCGREGR